MSAMPSTRARLAAIGGLTAIVLACASDRSTLTEPYGEPAYGIALGRDARGIPAGQVTFVRPQSARSAPRFDSTITATFTGIDSLSAGVYQLWYVTLDSATDAVTSAVKAVGTLRMIRTDTTINDLGDPEARPDTQTFTDVSAFSNGGSNRTFRFRYAPPAALLQGVADRHALLVTLETSRDAAAPGGAQPIWFRLSDFSSETRTIGTAPNVDTSYARVVPLRFGNFAPRRQDEYRFGVAGRGRLSFFQNRLYVFDSTLARPPRGYYYAVYGVRRDTVTNAVLDTIFLGEQTAPYPRQGVSLRGADSAVVDATVLTRPPSIVAAYTVADFDTLAATRSLAPRPFRQLAQVLVTLEPKLSRPDAASTHVVLSGVVPDVVRLGR